MIFESLGPSSETERSLGFGKSGSTNLEKTECHQRPVLRDSGGSTTVMIMT